MMQTSEQTRSKGGRRFLTVLVIMSFLGLFAGLVSLGYLYWQTQQQLAYLSSPEGQEALAQKETAKTLELLGQLVVLPTLPEGEEPIIATITDQAVLAAESDFYAQAENGDRLIIFPQAQRAYIYSPSRHRVVNIGPLAIEESSSLDAGLEREPAAGDDSSDPAPTEPQNSQSAGMRTGSSTPETAGDVEDSAAKQDAALPVSSDAPEAATP